MLPQKCPPAYAAPLIDLHLYNSSANFLSEYLAHLSSAFFFFPGTLLFCCIVNGAFLPYFYHCLFLLLKIVVCRSWI